MHRIFLSRAQAEVLVAFCKKHGQTTVRVANDHGVYVGQTFGQDQCLFYFPGCDPVEDPLWRELVRDRLWDMEICDEVDVEHFEEVLEEDPPYPFVRVAIEQLGTVVDGMCQLPRRGMGIPPRRPRPSKNRKKLRRKRF